MTPDHPHSPHDPLADANSSAGMTYPPEPRFDTGGVLLAIAVYVMAAVLGWAMIGVLLALWWHQ